MSDPVSISLRAGSTPSPVNIGTGARDTLDWSALTGVPSVNAGSGLNGGGPLTSSVTLTLNNFQQTGTGAVVSDLFTKAKERVSIEDFWDGGADYTTAFSRANTYLKGVGGGIIELGPKDYAVSQVVLSSGVILKGQGPWASRIVGTYNTATTGPVVTWENATDFINGRVDVAASLSATVASNVTMRNVSGYTAGDAVVFYSKTGSYISATINSINTGSKILNVTPTSSGALSIGDICYDITNPGPQFAGLVDLYIEGSRDTVAGLSNICAAQTRSGSGALTINGTAAGWSDNRARAAFLHNARVRIAATGDNTGRTLTLRGYAIKGDGTRVYQTETIAGPKSASQPVYSTKLYNEIPTTTDAGDGSLAGVSIDGTPTGNIYLGFCSLGDGAGILTWGPGVLLHNVIVQRCRGWGIQFDWIYPVTGWASPLAGQLHKISHVQSYLNDGGGLDFNSFVDGDVAHVTVNQCENQCVALRRLCAGFNLRNGHLSGAYESRYRFQKQFETLYVEADTAKVSQMALEGGSNGNLVILGNNAMVHDCRVFDPKSAPLPGGEAWVGNLQTTSPYTPTGLVMGDATLGYAATKCQVRIRTNNTSGGHVVMTSDGGENIIEVDGRDLYTALAGAVTTSQTVLPVSSNASLRSTQPVYIRDNNGNWNTKTLTAVTSSSSVVTMTIASPGVVSWTGHGKVAGDPVIFTTTGALPTGVTAGTVYYVIAAGLATDTFRFSATYGGSAVNTSGTQSGVHTATQTSITINSALSVAANAGNAVAHGLAISGSLKTSGSVDLLSRVRIDGYGINNQAYRWNWYATPLNVVTDSYTGNALTINGRASDGAGVLTFTDGSGSGAQSGTTRGQMYADSLGFRMVAASGLGANIKVNGTTDAVAADVNGNVVLGGRVGFPAVTTVNGSTGNVSGSVATVIVTYNGGTCTLTLPTASANTGHLMLIKTTVAQTTVSASSNVVPLAGGAAGTAILSATAGKWALLMSDGTNWIIMGGN